MSSKSSNYIIGVATRQFNERGKARVTLDEGGNLTVIPAEQHVAFPMPWNSSVISLRRPLPYRDRAEDLAVPIPLFC